MSWLNILIASFIGACLLGLCGFTVDFFRTVPAWVRRRERKQLTRFRRDVENEIPPNKITTCVAWVPGIGELIYPNEISPYRFLQNFTLILPDGKRVSFAGTPSADEAGTEAKK